MLIDTPTGNSLEADPPPLSFRYGSPPVEEQRAFAVQFVGSILGLAIIALLLLNHLIVVPVPDVLWGAAAGILYLLGRAAWKLEVKARRAQHGWLEVAADCLRISDGGGLPRCIPWLSVTRHDVVGGRLHLEWPGGQLVVGARELEDGMTFIREAMLHCQPPAAGSSGNFIPLEPR